MHTFAYTSKVLEGHIQNTYLFIYFYILKSKDFMEGIL